MLCPEKLLNFIKAGDKFLVAGHKEPDADCIGSQLALASALQRMEKEVILCSAGPFRRTEVKSFEQFFLSAPTEKDRDGANVIILDCFSLDRTGTLEPHLEGLPIAVVDHHIFDAGEQNPDCICFIDTNAPSTTFLVKKLIAALGLELTKAEAEYLFLGLCTDTGFFRHVDGEGAQTFDAAASLIRSGANPKVAYSAMYGGKTLDSRKLLGHILIKAESHFNAKLILVCMEYEDFCRLGLENRSSDTVYQLLQAVNGVEVIVLVREEAPGKCSVGLRSSSWVDVSNIAGVFGGGGHKNAAGFRYEGNIAELKSKIMLAFQNILSTSGS